jgi:predicted nucleic acid-binding protein
MRNKVFLDTAFAIASAIETDAFHEKALELVKEIKVHGIQIVTTRAVLLEIGNALSRANYRRLAVEAFDTIESDNNVTIVPLTEELFEEALTLYRSRMDKEWGLVDCVSFVTMNQMGITESLTTDQHFKQAGFIALL